MLNLKLVIKFHQERLNRLETLIGDLQKLVNNTEVTRKIKDELDMQIGEKDFCFDTIQYLKQLPIENEHIVSVFKRESEIKTF